MHFSHPKRILWALTLASFLGAFTACSEDKAASEVNSIEDTDYLFQTKNITGFGLSGTKKVVLTYDDGPTPATTTAILNTLRKYNIKATFFILGKNVGSNASLLKRMADEGHTIAHHTVSHPNLAGAKFQNTTNLFAEMKRGSTILEPFMRSSHGKYFRAPYGAWSSSHAAKLNADPKLAEYVGPIFWDIGGELQPKRPASASQIVSAADWDCWSKGLSAQLCAAGYLKETERKRGGVILMHDINMKTAAMTDIVVSELLKRGYQFVTLDDVRALDKYK